MGEISADLNASSGFKRLSGASEWAQSAVCLVGGLNLCLLSVWQILWSLLKKHCQPVSHSAALVLQTEKVPIILLLLDLNKPFFNAPFVTVTIFWLTKTRTLGQARKYSNDTLDLDFKISTYLKYASSMWMDNCFFHYFLTWFSRIKK